MHKFEGHRFASPFAPSFLVGEEQRISTGSLVDEDFPFRKRGAKVRRKGGLNLLHV